jgi:hypothetical protein
VYFVEYTEQSGALVFSFIIFDIPAIHKQISHFFTGNYEAIAQYNIFTEVHNSQSIQNI